MKFMASWNIAPGNTNAAVKGLLESGAPAPDGLTVLGRWHVGNGKGFALFEADEYAPVMQHMAEWNHLLDIEIYPVLEDAEAGAAMAAGKGLL